MAVFERHAACSLRAPILGTLTGGTKRLLVIIPKVVISLLMVSRGIISFDKHIAAVGTTSNNMLSKRKTLDEGSLLSSKSETQHDHRFTSTPYVPMDPGIGPLFNSPCVQKRCWYCVHQMNTYLSHAYIKTRLKHRRSFIQEHKSKGKPMKRKTQLFHKRLIGLTL